MPRRIPDYPDYFFKWNFVASFGSMISGVATVYFFYILINMFIRKQFFGISGWYSFILLAYNLIHIFFIKSIFFK